MKDESIIIPDPTLTSAEIPPEDEKSKPRHDGFGLIQAIYDFIVPRDLIAYTLVKKYKNILDLSKWWNNILFYPLIIICMVVDFVFTVIVELIILAIFLAITTSFIRGLGIIDWVMPIFKP